MNRLFIYGTLAPGRPNEHILKNLNGTWQEASVKGSLLDEGWGADMGNPGIILNSFGRDIKGYVFTSDELDKKWDFLDNYEGEEFERVIVEAKLNNSTYINTYIYALSQ